jgi:heme oxygenase (biliverdin-producing, ferredoxin)
VNTRYDTLRAGGTAGPLGKSLGDMLREATHALHVEAERSGVIGQLLRGGSTREAYALFLRNLSPAYRAMEDGLVRHANSPALRPMVRPELFRTAALESDVERLAGASWRESLPVLPAGERYVERVSAAAANGGGWLVAHSYLRYLGDLSGGQIMKRLLAKSLGLGADALGFYDFPAIADLSAFKSEYRKAIDGSVVAGANLVDVVDEAVVGFRLTIELSEAVAQASPR